jgi:type I restriction enzyme S subunit
MHRGDVLLGKRNAYLRRAAVAPHDGLFSAHGMVLNPIEGVVDKDFFPFFIFSNYFFDAAIRISVGSLSPTINWRDLAKIEFELPPISEQKEISEVLWSINDTIESYQELYESTDMLIRGRFVEMFGDPYTNPMEWPEKRFDEVAKIDANMTTDYQKYADYPHIGIDSIEKDTGRLVGYRTVQEDNVISGKYIFGPEHIIYSKIRPILNKVALPDFEGLCSAELCFSSK